MIKQNITVEGNTFNLKGGDAEPIATYIIWSYPQIYDHTDKSYIELCLEHTRAADNIRINYDSNRDGWVIKQASIFEFECTDKVVIKIGRKLLLYKHGEER